MRERVRDLHMDLFTICQSAQPIGRQGLHLRRIETGLEHWLVKCLAHCGSPGK